MTSSEQKIAEAVASLTARLEAWEVEDAATKAHQFVRDMLANGWRTTKAYVDVPPPSVPASEEARAAALQEARQRLVAAPTEEDA